MALKEAFRLAEPGEEVFVWPQNNHNQGYVRVPSVNEIPDWCYQY
jgi:hypothetical protein